MSQLSEDLLALAIKVEGGTASAAEIQKVQGALKGIATQDAKTKEQVKSPIEHAGIYLFSRQLLDTIGLGLLAQHAFAAIDATFTKAAESIGLTSAELAPLLLVMGVGITVFELWEKHAKKTTKSLDQLKKKEQESYNTTLDLLEALKKYRDEMATIPPEMRHLISAETDLEAVQRHRLMTTEAQAMATAQLKIISLEEQIGAQKDAIAAMQQEADIEKTAGDNAVDWSKKIKEAGDQIKKLNEQIIEQKALFSQNQANIKMQADGYKGYEDAARNASKRAKEAADAWMADPGFEKWNKNVEAMVAGENAAAEADKKLEAAKLRLGAAVASLGQKESQYREQEAENVDGLFQAKIDAIRAAAASQAAEVERMYAREIAAAKKAGVDTAVLEKQKHDTITALARDTSEKEIAAGREFFGLASNNAKQYEQIALTTFHGVSNAFSQSIARMIVEHKKFSDEMKAMSISVTEQLIADVIKTQVETLASYALRTKAAAAADAAAITGIHTKTAAVVELDVALKAATAQALALDAAMLAAP